MTVIINSVTNPTYFFAGKGRHGAVFTVSNNKKGQHHTFKIKASKDGGCFFVSKLTAPDYYSFMGTIFDKFCPVVKASAKSKVPANHVAFRVVTWALTQVILGKELPDGYAIQHNGCCSRCGRTLTDPTSIDLGIGPICANAMGIVSQVSKQRSVDPESPDFDDNEAEAALAMEQQ